MRISKSFYKPGLALKKELLLLGQINQWLGVLGDTYGMEVASLSNHSILRTCMTDLGWYQRKQKQSFSISRRQLAPNARESKKITSFIQHTLHERDMKIMPIKVSNTSWMFSMNHGGKIVADGPNNNHQNFHEDGIP